MAWLRTSLLPAVQQAHPLFPQDSKHFVDMPVKTSVAAMMQGWQQLEKQQPLATREQLQAFVACHFGEPGSDMEVVLPEGWDECGPSYLQQVTPASVGQLGRKVHNLWRLLHRKVSADVLADASQHTLLPLPHPFVVPGDRFREVYYWDSYWIILGLIASGLYRTAVGMVRNLLSLVDAYGFVPNGTRTYYTNRSQPPLLSAMVAACHAAVTDAEGPEAGRQLLAEALPRLLKTMEYWTTGGKALSVCVRGSDGKAGACHRLSRYCADWEEPRPESYREDVALAAGLSGPQAKRLYREIASAAESGWDFSSRWFADGRNLSTIRTTQVVPVDLNALLYLNARHISTFATELGDTATAATFIARADALKAAINDLMWNEQAGCWHDLLLLGQADQEAGGGDGGGGGSGGGRLAGGDAVLGVDSLAGSTTSAAPPAAAAGAGAAAGRAAGAGAGAAAGDAAEAGAGAGAAAGGAAGTGAGAGAWVVEQRSGSYASNWVPLWCGCSEPGSGMTQSAVRGLQASGLIAEGGVLTSTYETGQQWDAPNAWAPLQHMLIQALKDSGVPEGQTLADRLARAWVRNNRLAFERTGHMHEKYDARVPGAAGGGGEYEPQVGFGWTNGVLLELLRLYPHQDS